MKKLVMLLALAVAFSLSGFAQTSSSSTSGGTSSTDTGKTAKKGKKASSDTDMAGSKAGKSSTITGCLKSDATPVTIANGKHKNGVEVDTSGASSEDWSKHNGHKVQLTGSWEGTGADKKFKATSMKHIAETCSVGGKTSAAEGGAKKKGKKGASDTTKTPS